MCVLISWPPACMGSYRTHSEPIYHWASQRNPDSSLSSSIIWSPLNEEQTSSCLPLSALDNLKRSSSQEPPLPWALLQLLLCVSKVSPVISRFSVASRSVCQPQYWIWSSQRTPLGSSPAAELVVSWGLWCDPWPPDLRRFNRRISTHTEAPFLPFIPLPKKDESKLLLCICGPHHSAEIDVYTHRWISFKDRPNWLLWRTGSCWRGCWLGPAPRLQWFLGWAERDRLRFSAF